MGLLSRWLTPLAVRDPVVFAAQTMRDASTGSPVRLEPFHERIIRSRRHPAPQSNFPEHGKTSCVAPTVSWLLARNPRLTVAMVSNTIGQATRQASPVQRSIGSPDAQRIFRIRPHSTQWTQLAFSVAAKPGDVADPNVQVASLDGSGLLGARIGLIVLDDLDSLATTATPHARDATWRWVTSTILSRLAPGGRVIFLSTSWHRADAMHRFIDLGGVDHVRIPIQDTKGNPTWAARWPPDRIASRRRELGPRLARRVLDCVAAADDGCIFDPTHVQAMITNGLALPTTHYVRPTGRYVLGVDVGFSTNAGADRSALVVVRCCDDGVREVVHVRTGRWNFDQLVACVVETAQAFGAVAAVESNAGGNFVYQAVRKQVAATALHTSQSSKIARVEFLAAELAAARWRFRPHDRELTPEMRALADGLTAFSPDEHTPDEVAALLVAVEQIRDRENKPRAQFGHLDLHRARGL
ncbi:MAG: hypothetical protein IPG50_09500 [Myxococcales bacterium]|nr:hypothetical protein [Myxococcales bacterium]